MVIAYSFFSFITTWHSQGNKTSYTCLLLIGFQSALFAKKSKIVKSPKTKTPTVPARFLSFSFGSAVRNLSFVSSARVFSISFTGFVTSALPLYLWTFSFGAQAGDFGGCPGLRSMCRAWKNGVRTTAQCLRYRVRTCPDKRSRKNAYDNVSEVHICM